MHKNRAHLTVVLKEGDAARRVRVIKPVWERTRRRDRGQE